MCRSVKTVSGPSQLCCAEVIQTSSFLILIQANKSLQSTTEAVYRLCF